MSVFRSLNPSRPHSLASLAAVACAIHCAVWPGALLTLGFIGAVVAHEEAAWVNVVFVAISVVVVAVYPPPGDRKLHWGMWAACGLVVTGIALEALEVEGGGWLVIGGSLVLSAGHLVAARRRTTMVTE